MKCRGCYCSLEKPFLNLGLHPLSNAFVKQENKNEGEMFYPLEVFICEKCWLAQLSEPAKREAIFTEDYVYFSSFSQSWLNHADHFSGLAIDKLALNSNSLVMEIASNDGYLLQYFKGKGIPVLGVEPSASVAQVAISKKIDTVIDFFGKESAQQIVSKYGHADLICANNVLAHVPNLHDFVGGFKNALKPTGVITFEFPHLLSLMNGVQFDTVYHEHFSYISVMAVNPIFQKAGLKIFDVQKLSTHGGSLRLWLTHEDNSKYEVQSSVVEIMREEEKYGLNQILTYRNFNKKVEKVREDLLKFLIEAKRNEQTVVAYGAAAKGNTLLNYCGIRADLISSVADRNPVKQGRLLPGSRIPVVSPEDLMKKKPDYIVILPWNLKSEIVEQLKEARSWGCQFVVPVPNLELF